MKKAFKLLLISALSLFAIVGCATEKEKDIKPSTAHIDKFRTINANRNSQDMSVVCTNCRAKFKISRYAMKSGATVRCPVCKHLYRTGQH